MREYASALAQFQDEYRSRRFIISAWFLQQFRIASSFCVIISGYGLYDAARRVNFILRLLEVTNEFKSMFQHFVADVRTFHDFDLKHKYLTMFGVHLPNLWYDNKIIEDVIVCDFYVIVKMYE